MNNVVVDLISSHVVFKELLYLATRKGADKLERSKLPHILGFRPQERNDIGISKPLESIVRYQRNNACQEVSGHRDSQQVIESMLAECIQRTGSMLVLGAAPYPKHRRIRAA